MILPTFLRFWSLFVLAFSGSMASMLAAPKLLPVLNHPISDRSGLIGSPLVVDLAAAFGMEPIDAQVVRFTSQYNSNNVPVALDMVLFSNRTPVTRQNFLKYVSDGDYVNSFIHRSVPGFVIQGGGFQSNNGINLVPTDPPIINEFGISNTLGTISMAKSGGDPNSATSQWFVSLNGNSDILDPQNGGFTVFGRMTRATLNNALLFGNPDFFPVYGFNSPFNELPLFYTYENAPETANALNYIIQFPSVSLVPLPDGQAGEDPALVYSLIANSRPEIATASIQANGKLGINPSVGQTGATVLTVRATDSVGNTVDDTFTVTVQALDTYTTWASRNLFPGNQSGISLNPDGDAWNNLQEYAFFGLPGTPNGTSPPLIQEIQAAVSGDRYLTVTFPVRKYTQGLVHAVEANDGLSGTWTEIWNSAGGYGHPQVVTTVDQPDRTLVTIKDTVTVGSHPKRFLRIKVTQQ